MLIMTKHAKPTGFRDAAVAVLWLAAAFLFCATGLVSAQVSQTPQNSAPAAQQTPLPPPLPPQPPPADKPGFFGMIGRWWDSSMGFFHDRIRETPATFEDIGKKSGDAAKGAAAVTGEGMKKTLDVGKDAALATGEGMKKTLDVGKDAATAIGRLPDTRVIEMHATCEKAPNSAPDCAAAAANACLSRGFKGGKPLDVGTAEKCDTTRAWMTGQASGKGDCPIESWVTRAVCQ